MACPNILKHGSGLVKATLCLMNFVIPILTGPIRKVQALQ